MVEGIVYDFIEEVFDCLHGWKGEIWFLKVGDRGRQKYKNTKLARHPHLSIIKIGWGRLITRMNTVPSQIIINWLGQTH